jgi:hypothetical protein
MRHLPGQRVIGQPVQGDAPDPGDDAVGVPARAGLRVHEAIGHREAFGLNWDPSHFVWQGLDPVMFIWDIRDRIYHVDCKDARLRTGNGRRGVLGSLPRLCLPGAQAEPAIALLDHQRRSAPRSPVRYRVRSLLAAGGSLTALPAARRHERRKHAPGGDRSSYQ